MKLRFTRIALVLAAAMSTGLAQAQAPSAPPPAAAPSTPKPAPGKADAGVTPELFYRLMLAEVALQRGEPALAARALLEVARETREAPLARRATEVALFARQRAMATEAAQLWSDLEPGADRPKQIVAALASGANVPNRFHEDAPESELRERLEKFLADAAATGGGVAEPFMQLNRVLSQQSDKLAVYRLITDLARPYPNSPEANFAVGVAALNTGLTEPDIAKSALASVDRALVLKPEWDRGLLLKAEIVGKRSTAEAIALLEGALKRQPESKPLSGALAQFLVEEKRFAEARALYRKVFEADRSQRELQFGIAVLSIQMKDWAGAEADLSDLKAAGFGDPGQVEFYLAQVSEERGRLDEAIARYGEVPEGERCMAREASHRHRPRQAGQARRGEAASRGAARGHDRAARAGAPDRGAALPRRRTTTRRHSPFSTRRSSTCPTPPTCSTTGRWLLEKLDRIDDAEKVLRRLVELKPDDAQALNALGYTLVDRTDRVEEGFELIERAHKLAPSDPFILDSLGWAYYRLGKLDEAERHLMRAFAVRPDPEIAAHLGEVLWARGQPQKARELWQSQLKEAPDHPVLLETMRRHQR